MLKAIDDGLKPFTKKLKRAVIEEDLVRLTEIRIKRISKFDIDKAQQKIDKALKYSTRPQYIKQGPNILNKAPTY